MHACDPTTDYDPFAADFAGRAHEIHDSLRAKGPALRVSQDRHWVVTGHAECRRLLRSGAWAPSDVAAQIEGIERTSGNPLPALRQLSREIVFFRSGPGHMQARRFLGRVLNQRPIPELEPEARTEVDAILRGLVADGGGDMVDRLARPLPRRMMGRLLGIPEEDMIFLADCAEDLAIVADIKLEMDRLIEANARVAMALDHLGDLCAERDAAPRDDGLTRMARQGRDEGLTGREVAARALFLFVAGLETTTTFLSAAMLALLEHPDETARWRGGEITDEMAVEELLRHTSPITLVTRHAVEDTEIGGHAVPARTRATLLLEAANRDPAVFPDPHRLDLGRTPGPHLAFGDGIHACLGASLARLQGTAALRAFAALPLTLVNQTPRPYRSHVIRPLATLMVKIS